MQTDFSIVSDSRISLAIRCYRTNQMTMGINCYRKMDSESLYAIKSATSISMICTLSAKEVNRIFQYRVVGYYNNDAGLKRFEDFFKERVEKIRAFPEDKRLYAKWAIKGAILVSNLTFIREFCRQEGPSILNETDTYGMTPLYLAVNYEEYQWDEHTDIHGKPNKDFLDLREGYKKLNRHADYSFKLAKTLLELGADVNALSWKYKSVCQNDFETPLDAAARGLNNKLGTKVKFLADEYKELRGDMEDEELLDLSAKRNNERFIQLLYIYGGVTHISNEEALANIDCAMQSLFKDCGFKQDNLPNDCPIFREDLKGRIGKNDLDYGYYK